MITWGRRRSRYSSLRTHSQLLALCLVFQVRGFILAPATALSCLRREAVKVRLLGGSTRRYGRTSSSLVRSSSEGSWNSGEQKICRANDCSSTTTPSSMLSPPATAAIPSQSRLHHLSSRLAAPRSSGARGTSPHLLHQHHEQPQQHRAFGSFMPSTLTPPSDDVVTSSVSSASCGGADVKPAGSVRTPVVPIGSPSPSSKEVLIERFHSNDFFFAGHDSSSGEQQQHSGVTVTPPATNVALIFLNNHGGFKEQFILERLWRCSAVRLCADGGSNRLYDSFDNDADRQRHTPDYIVGDLDSIRPKVRKFYEEDVDGGSGRLIEVADQDHNDFEKCLRKAYHLGFELQARKRKEEADKKDGAGAGDDDCNADAVTDEIDWRKEEGDGASVPPRCPLQVVVLGAFGGRFDQEMAVMHALHAYTPRFERLLLIGQGNLAFLLEPGVKHVIKTDRRFEGPTCGLIPIGGACKHITTTGLKWNLTNQALEFGVLVSSSNHILEEGSANSGSGSGTSTGYVSTLGLMDEGGHDEGLEEEKGEKKRQTARGVVTAKRSSDVTVVTDKPLVWTIEIDREELMNIMRT